MWEFLKLKKILFLATLFAIGFQDEDIEIKKEAKDQQSIPGAGLSIVFIFGGLLFGGILKAISQKIKISYSPLLLISGIFLGIFHKSLGFIGQSTKLISQINPNGLLAIFLPALIFESAYKTQWHMFKKQFEQTLILGAPCVLISALFIMTGVKLLIGYDATAYSWLQAFLLGCILCCTDIFSFVSKLKEYSTPQKIISLVEGQSLFNYCTCFLIFQIINEVVVDVQNYSVLALLELFVQETIGGIMFGVVFGFIALFCIKRVSNDGILVVTLMVIFCYFIYMAAQFSVLRVCGIIAVVTYGIFMGIFAKAHIVGDAEECMSSFWDYAVFVAETNIFLISGVFVGINVFFLEQLVTIEEIKTIFFIYALVLLSRYISILLFQKKLSKLGYGMQWRESIIIAFTGLKGAIGISFAMIIFENTNYSLYMRNLFLLHVTGNSILTLLINGTATPLALKFLNVTTLTKVEYKLFSEFLAGFKQKIEEKKNSLRKERFLNIVDWDQINSKTGIEDISLLQQEVQKTLRQNNFKTSNKFEKRQLYLLEKALRDFANAKQKADNLAEKQYEQQITSFHIVVEIRKRFIKKLRYCYWTYQEEQHTMPDAILLLIQSASFDLDTETEELESWSWIKNQFSETIKVLSQLRKTYIIGSLARNYLFSYISYCYDVVISYIQANEEVREEFLQNNNFTDFNEEAVNLILSQSHQNMKEAEDFLKNYLQPSFPEIQREVKTRKSSFLLLFAFQNQINRLFKTGQLETSQYETLNNIIEQKKMTLELHNPKWTSQKFKDSLKADDVFGVLPQKILEVIEENLTVFQTYNSNEVIQNQNSLGKYIYFIRRGCCTAELVNNNVMFKESLVVGDLFGYESLVSKNYHSNITTKTLLVVLGVKKVCIQKIMDFFPKFEEQFWKKYLFSLLKMFSKNSAVSYYLTTADRNSLQKITSMFTLERLQPGIHEIKQDLIFFRGSAKVISDVVKLSKKDSIQHMDEITEQNEKLDPLAIIEAKDEISIEILERSSFLVGKFDTKEIENPRQTNFSTYKKKYQSVLESPKKDLTKIFQF